MRLTLQDIRNHQTTNSIHCGNTTETGIVNGKVKIQRSRSMEMQYFYICDLVKNGEVQLNWHPGQENLCEYASKNHDEKYHQHVSPIYLHESNSPRALPWATKRSVLRGCLGTIPGRYVHCRPLTMYGETMTHVTRIRTHIAPEKYHE